MSTIPSVVYYVQDTRDSRDTRRFAVMRHSRATGHELIVRSYLDKSVAEHVAYVLQRHETYAVEL